jgi:ribosomal protein L7Ae-like RNA K-turn-binding protein
VRKRVNRMVVRSVHMACDVERVQEVETLDATCKKKCIEFS